MPLKKPAFHKSPRAGYKTGKFYHRESSEQSQKTLENSTFESRMGRKIAEGQLLVGSTLDGMGVEPEIAGSGTACKFPF